MMSTLAESQASPSPSDDDVCWVPIGAHLLLPEAFNNECSGDDTPPRSPFLTFQRAPFGRPSCDERRVDKCAGQQLTTEQVNETMRYGTTRGRGRVPASTASAAEHSQIMMTAAQLLLQRSAAEVGRPSQAAKSIACPKSPKNSRLANSSFSSWPNALDARLEARMGGSSSGSGSGSCDPSSPCSERAHGSSRVGALLRAASGDVALPADLKLHSFFSL